MPDGNRYAAAMDPQAGPAGPPPAMPPQGAPPGPPGAAPQGQPAAPAPELVEAFKILSGHEGPIADLLKDPAKLPQIRIAFDAIKQDPAAQAQLAKIGITPDKLQMFEQMLTQAEHGQTKAPASHWLAK